MILLWEEVNSPKARLFYYLEAQLNRGQEVFYIDGLCRISGVKPETLIRWLSMIFRRNANELTFAFRYSEDILNCALGQAWYFPGQDITAEWLARFSAINCAKKITEDKGDLEIIRISKIFIIRLKAIVDEIRKKERERNLPIIHPLSVKFVLHELLDKLARHKGCEGLLKKPLADLLEYAPTDEITVREYKGRRPPEKGNL